PYLVLLGFAARLTGATPLSVLYAAGAANLLLFVFAFHTLACRTAPEEAARFSPLAPLLHCAPSPRIPLAARAWPVSRSLADSRQSSSRSQGGRPRILAVPACLVAAARRVPRVALSAVLGAGHALTGLAWASAVWALLAAEGFGRRWSARRGAFLLALPLLA